jgi:hypothetical protein
VFTIDSALQHTCAIFDERAACGEITGAERDLLIDGAILLAANLEGFVQDAQAGEITASWPDAFQRPAAPILLASGPGERSGACRV